MVLKEKNKYSFPSGKYYLNFQTAIVTGVGRSGKSTLGNLLAKNHYVEHSEEPWLPNLLSVMTDLKMIDHEVGRDMFISQLHELMNDMILLRQANFRKGDGSSIWTKKTAKEISFRLNKLETRVDVQNFIKKNKPILLLVLRESPLYNLPAIFDFLPNTKIIHVVRRGIDVAHNLKEKGWNSDRQLRKPSLARIFYEVSYRGKPFYIPSWIEPKDRKKFIMYPEYERGLLYWCSLMERIIKSSKKLPLYVGKKQYLTIKFEDLIENPERIMEKANLFFGMKSSSLAKAGIYSIKNYHNTRHKAPKLSGELLARTKKIYKHFNYDWN